MGSISYNSASLLNEWPPAITGTYASWDDVKAISDRHAHATLKIHAVFKWHPSTPGQPPSERINFIEKSSVSISVDSDIEFSNVSNGLNGSVVWTNPNAEPGENGITTKTYICKSSVLGVKKSNGDIEVDGPTRTLTGELTLHTPTPPPDEDGGDQSRNHAILNMGLDGEIQGMDDDPSPTSSSLTTRRGSSVPDYTVAIDDRSVKITRSGARGERQDPNDPNTWHGDTTFSYNQDSLVETTNYEGLPSLSTESNPVINTQNFGNSFSGLWSDYRIFDELENQYFLVGRDYVWSPSDSRDHLVFSTPKATWPHSQDIENGSLNKGTDGLWYGTKTPSTQQNISLTVTDNSTDQAKATAHYVLHIHDEWDNIQKTDDGYGKEYSTYSACETTIPQGGQSVTALGHSVTVTYQHAPFIAKFGSTILTGLIGAADTYIGHLGTGFAQAAEWTAVSVVGKTAVNNFNLSLVGNTQDITETISTDPETNADLWDKAVQYTVDPSPAFSGTSPILITGDATASNTLVQQAIGNTTLGSDHKPPHVGDTPIPSSELWAHASLTGIGLIHISRPITLTADQYDTLGKLRSQQFEIPVVQGPIKVGVFTTHFDTDELLNKANFVAQDEPQMQASESESLEKSSSRIADRTLGVKGKI